MLACQSLDRGPRETFATSIIPIAYTGLDDDIRDKMHQNSDLHKRQIGLYPLDQMRAMSEFVEEASRAHSKVKLSADIAVKAARQVVNNAHLTLAKQHIPGYSAATAASVLTAGQNVSQLESISALVLVVVANLKPNARLTGILLAEPMRLC